MGRDSAVSASITCPACGALAEPSQKFCNSCGRRWRRLQAAAARVCRRCSMLTCPRRPRASSGACRQPSYGRHPCCLLIWWGSPRCPRRVTRRTFASYWEGTSIPRGRSSSAMAAWSRSSSATRWWPCGECRRRARTTPSELSARRLRSWTRSTCWAWSRARRDCRRGRESASRGCGASSTGTSTGSPRGSSGIWAGARRLAMASRTGPSFRWSASASGSARTPRSRTPARGLQRAGRTGVHYQRAIAETQLAAWLTGQGRASDAAPLREQSSAALRSLGAATPFGVRIAGDDEPVREPQVAQRPR